MMLCSITVFGNFRKKVRSLTVLEYAHQNETFQVYFSNSVASFTFIDDVFPSFFTTRLEVTSSSDSAHKKESREPRCSLTLVYVISYQSLGAGVWDRLWLLLLFWIPPAFCWHHDDAVKKAKTKKPIPIGSRMRFPHNRWIRCMNCWHLGTFSTFFKRVLAINCVHTTNEVRRFFFMFRRNGRERALAQMSEKLFA